MRGTHSLPHSQCFAKCPFTCQFGRLSDQLCRSLDRLFDHFAKHCAQGKGDDAGRTSKQGDSSAAPLDGTPPAPPQAAPPTAAAADEADGEARFGGLLLPGAALREFLRSWPAELRLYQQA
jgi:hypothetical protein